MDYELTSQKLDQNNHLIKNKVTNEPVAFIEKNTSYGGRGSIKATWHPTFKLLHPEVHDNIITRNFERKYDSVNDAVSNIGYRSKPYVFGRDVDKDPVKTKYQGITERNGEDAHTWSMHDDDGEHIGNVTSKQGPDTIHKDTPVRIVWKKEYLDKNTVPESVKEAAAKKHAGEQLSTSLKRVRYILDNKSKEPRFIGTQSSERAGAKLFKTKLNPEDASAAYEEHLRKNLEPSYTFTRHSPTSFSAIEPAVSRYRNASQHHVISMPGELHHITASIAHPESSGNKNAEIVESYIPPAKKKYEALTLETHMKITRRMR